MFRKKSVWIFCAAGIAFLCGVTGNMVSRASEYTEPEHTESEYAGSEYSKDGSKMAEDIAEDIIGGFEFGDMDEELRELFPKERFRFEDALTGVLSGDYEFTGKLLKRLVSDQLTYAFRSCRENLIHILLIAVIAAVFHNFSNVFQSRQISEVSFYILYLLLIALCLNSFEVLTDWVEGGIKSLTGFMGVFCPLYFAAVSVAKGSVTAVAFYNLVLFLIFLVELLIVKFLLPLIHIYMMVKVLNFLSPEEYLSKSAELLGTLTAWILKTLLACIIGLNVIQSLINPAIDSVKQSVVTRGAEAIPGIGDALGGVTEVALGTAVLVKNGVGMTGAVICIALCVLPLLQIGCIVLMYKLAAALIQPVSDKRIVGCVESVGDGGRLLMQTVFTVGLLFLLTIVIVAASTGKV